MSFSWLKYRRLAIICFVVSCADARCVAADPTRFGLESVCAQAGFGASSTCEGIFQSEAVLGFSLPSDWDLGKDWRTWLRLDTSAGWLGQDDHGGLTFAAVPTLVLGRPPFPVTVEIGVGPRYIKEWEFKEKNLGSHFQISSALGPNLELTRWLRLSYRFQHMSNGGLAVPNQGLNLHFVALRYVF
jgi:hypothetical protein